MIDQTIPLPQLAGGMARCLREWILPHLSDPMARTQAENLAQLIESLPGALSAEARRAIDADSAAARDMLRRFGLPAAEAKSEDVDAALRDNSALKAHLQMIADELRGDASEESGQRLRELQVFFVESVRREIEMARRSADFAAMTSREGAARES